MFQSLLTGGPIGTARPIRTPDFSVLIQDAEPATLPRLYSGHHVIGIPLDAGHAVARIEDTRTWTGRLEPGEVSLRAAGPGERVVWPEGARCLYLHLSSALVHRAFGAPGSLASFPRLRDARLFALGRELHHLTLSNPVDESAARQLVGELVSQLVARHPAPARPAPTIGHVSVEAILDRLRLDDPATISMTRLAAACGLTRAHFTRRFRAVVGMSPHALRLASRIERAKHLLARHHASIAEIALACGFADQAHLSRAFRALAGTTPARCRNAQR